MLLAASDRRCVSSVPRLFVDLPSQLADVKATWVYVYAFRATDNIDIFHCSTYPEKPCVQLLAIWNIGN